MIVSAMVAVGVAIASLGWMSLGWMLVSGKSAVGVTEIRSVVVSSVCTAGSGNIVGVAVGVGVISRP